MSSWNQLSPSRMNPVIGAAEREREDALPTML